MRLTVSFDIYGHRLFHFHIYIFPHLHIILHRQTKTIFFMKRILLLGVLCSFVITSAAQSSWPSTLLWRISGNGLSKDSYLFGSMHLQDKRIFQLSDSLYHYLEKAEGFAMEIDMQEFMDSMVQKSINENIYGAKDEAVKSPPPSLEAAEVPPPAEERLSKRDLRRLRKLREEKIAALLKTEKMPVILDVYLYGLASRLDKWVGGIEDVSDQLQILDELGRALPEKDIEEAETVMKSMLEKMIAIYTAQDLAMVDSLFIRSYDKTMEDLQLIQRNYKMAERMDSLGHIRSTFFTVGAAHLPGAEGVITLLRQKGFTVEPVFGSAKVNPDDYRRKLASIAWKPVSDENGTFSIDMPGKASDLAMFGEALRMKMAYDVLDQEFYMAGAIAKTYANAENELNLMRKRMEGKIKNIKKIVHNGMPGFEGSTSYLNYRYSIRYIVGNNSIYMMMIGMENTNKKTSNEKRFFDSFKSLNAPPKKTFASTQQRDDEGAFSLTWPGSFKRNELLQARVDPSVFTARSWDFIDMANSQYYIMQVIDVKAGLVLPSDSAYFEELRSGLKARTSHLKEEWGKHSGYNYYRAEGASEDVRFKSFALIRGNRIYQLVTAMAAHVDPDVDSAFFASFQLHDYPEPAWHEAVSPDGDFRIKLPSSALLKRKAGEDASGEPLEEWVCVGANPVDAASYRIEKIAIGRYKEVEDTLAFLTESIEHYKLETETVLSKREVKNGDATGVEWTMLKNNSHTAKQIRLLLHGDSLYLLLMIEQEADIKAKRYQPFFDSFVFTRKLDVSNKISKTDRLFNDLLSTDSATYSRAATALYEHTFQPKDLERLREMIVSEIPGDSLHAGYVRSRFVLAGKLYDVGNDATVDFLSERYKKVPAENDQLQDDILHGMASIRTQHSYRTLLKLLLEKTPSPDSSGTFTFSPRIYDSLELTKTLYPDLLQLLSKPYIAMSVIDITDRMMKEGQLDKTVVQPFLPIILKQADSYLQQGWSELDRNYEGYKYTDMLHLLGYFPDTAVASRIRRFLSPEIPAALDEGIHSLIRMKQPVPAKALSDLAANPFYRQSLYELLDTTGNQSLFPAKYKNQRSFAESEIATYFSLDDWKPSIEFLKEKKIRWKGKECRIFLYKITDEGMEAPMLGIAGPYALDPSDLKTNSELTGYYENYQPKDIDKLFEEYLKQTTEASKDEE